MTLRFRDARQVTNYVKRLMRQNDVTARWVSTGHTREGFHVQVALSADPTRPAQAMRDADFWHVSASKVDDAVYAGAIYCRNADHALSQVARSTACPDCPDYTA